GVDAMPGHPGPGGDGLRGSSPMAAGIPSRWKTLVGGGSVAALILVGAGCAARQSAETATGRPHDTVAPRDLAPPPPPWASVQSQIDEKMREHREAAAANKPVVVENNDAALARALKAAEDSPSADNYRRAAVEYRRVQVYDQAHDYFKRAIALDPKNAAAFDGLGGTGGGRG